MWKYPTETPGNSNNNTYLILIIMYFSIWYWVVEYKNVFSDLITFLLDKNAYPLGKVQSEMFGVKFQKNLPRTIFAPSNRP